MPCVVAERADLVQVGEADRLAAGHVDRGGDADVRDVLGADLVDDLLQLGEVDVALEGVLAHRVVRLVDDDVDEAAAGQFLVEAGGREVHVAGDHVALLDERLAEQVLGAAALMRRHEVLVAVDLPDRRLEVVEVAAAGVGLVAEHHAGPLAVAHRRGAGVGEQVDVDVLAAQQEGVVAGLADRGLALLAGGHLEGLHHLDLERLRPAAAAWLGHRSSIVSVCGRPEAGRCVTCADPRGARARGARRLSGGRRARTRAARACAPRRGRAGRARLRPARTRTSPG